MLIGALIVLCLMVDTVVNDGVLMNGRKMNERYSGMHRISRSEAPRLYWAALIIYGAIVTSMVLLWYRRRQYLILRLHSWASLAPLVPDHARN